MDVKTLVGEINDNPEMGVKVERYVKKLSIFIFLVLVTLMPLPITIFFLDVHTIELAKLIIQSVVLAEIILLLIFKRRFLKEAKRMIEVGWIPEYSNDIFRSKPVGGAIVALTLEMFIITFILGLIWQDWFIISISLSLLIPIALIVITMISDRIWGHSLHHIAYGNVDEVAEKITKTLGWMKELKVKKEKYKAYRISSPSTAINLWVRKIGDGKVYITISGIFEENLSQAKEIAREIQEIVNGKE